MHETIVTYRADFVLLVVVIDDRLRQIVKRLEALDDCLLVVVDPSARLCPLQQPLLHRFVCYLEVEDAVDGCNVILEALALVEFPGVAVDEEPLAGGRLLQHGIAKQSQHGFLVGKIFTASTGDILGTSNI